LKQLSALKQQYQDDLKSLTQAYDSRRKVLKDALLFYSAPVAGSAFGGGTSDAASERDSHDAEPGKGDRKLHRARNEEK
jgi:hypothetical protein